MNRRDALKCMALPAAGAVVNSVAGPLLGSEAPVEPATALTPALEKYQRLRFGCSFHFSTPTFTGDDYDVGAVPPTVYNPT